MQIMDTQSLMAQDAPSAASSPGLNWHGNSLWNGTNMKPGSHKVGGLRKNKSANCIADSWRTLEAAFLYPVPDEEEYIKSLQTLT